MLVEFVLEIDFFIVFLIEIREILFLLLGIGLFFCVRVLGIWIGLVNCELSGFFVGVLGIFLRVWFLIVLF